MTGYLFTNGPIYPGGGDCISGGAELVEGETGGGDERHRPAGSASGRKRLMGVVWQLDVAHDDPVLAATVFSQPAQWLYWQTQLETWGLNAQ